MKRKVSSDVRARDDQRASEIVIEKLGFGGIGIGRLSDGKICFVPRVLPGERVKVQIRSRHASYVEADLREIVEASPERVRPKCPVFGRCGGCQYQHAAYSKQLEIKSAQVAEVLGRLGGAVNVPIEPIVASPLEFHYRNRITVHVKSGRIGFFAHRSRRIVEVKECPLATESVNGLLAELRTSCPKDGAHPLREASDYRGFRQVNDAVAGRLLEIVEEMAQPGGELLVDAYCGAGFFAKRLAPLFGLTVGIEWSVDAVRAARQAAGAREIYLLGDVGRHLIPALAAAPSRRTTLLLDPPEEGLDEKIIGIIVSKPPARILYVSCNPATLARDLKRLAPLFSLRRARPLDMFPQTAEIEVAVLLEGV